jgi:hypothetical protein
MIAAWLPATEAQVVIDVNVMKLHDPASEIENYCPYRDGFL